MKCSVTGWVLKEAKTEMELGMQKVYCERKREETRFGEVEPSDCKENLTKLCPPEIAH